MGQFSIIRFQKHKSKSSLVNIQKHNDRSKAQAHTDPDGYVKKIYGTDKPIPRLNEVLDHYNIKPRKNAVLFTEAVMTFSPEAKGEIDIDQWAKDSVDFLKSKFPQGAILNAYLHMDESTPHIHALIVPLNKKTIKKKLGKDQYKEKDVYRLVARDYFGTRKLLADWQTDYADAMRKHGLERGVRFSKREHKTVSEWRREAGRALQEADAIFEQANKNKDQEPALFGKKDYWKNLADKYYQLAKFLFKKNTMLEKRTKKMDEDLRELTAAMNNATEKLKHVLTVSGLDYRETLAELLRLREQRAEHHARQAVTVPAPTPAPRPRKPHPEHPAELTLE